MGLENSTPSDTIQSSICKQCGEKFLDNSADLSRPDEYCSDECYDKSTSSAVCEKCKGKSPFGEPICPVCKIPETPLSPASPLPRVDHGGLAHLGRAGKYGSSPSVLLSMECPNCSTEMEHIELEEAIQDPSSADGAGYHISCGYLCPECGRGEDCDSHKQEPEPSQD